MTLSEAIIKAREICQEVLRLDAKATPGTWEAVRGNAGSEHPLFLFKQNKSAGGIRVGSDADCRLIAFYRGVTPEYARLVLAFCDNDCEDPDCELYTVSESTVDGYCPRCTALIAFAESREEK